MELEDSESDEEIAEIKKPLKMESPPPKQASSNMEQNPTVGWISPNSLLNQFKSELNVH